jgi:N-acylneuraminate cytidylyltransferase
MQYQSLPEIWVQNSSLEIAWRRVLEGDQPSIAGDRVAPFFTEGDEGFSIDYPEDLERAERLVARNSPGKVVDSDSTAVTSE